MPGEGAPAQDTVSEVTACALPFCTGAVTAMPGKSAEANSSPSQALASAQVPSGPGGTLGAGWRARPRGPPRASAVRWAVVSIRFLFLYF